MPPSASKSPRRSTDTVATDGSTLPPPSFTEADGVEEASLDPYIGTTVANRYRVIDKLGAGGMGVVYLAEHVLIEKKVALKILGEEFARKEDLVARFLQEAKAASKIGHEHIVDITDFGHTATGSVFLAMEYLEGMDLADHLDRDGAMPVARVRSIVLQICRALEAAHDKGIIHRDLKPENIFLITRNGQSDFVKVLDFGIAKMNSLDEPSSPLTRTGMIFGTPEYMSPEQAKGDRPDHRIDIYALGCIMYEMLTGEVPFRADSFMGVLTRHAVELPIRPSRRCPSVPPQIERIVLRALAKDGARRYQSMGEFADAIESGVVDTTGLAWADEGASAAPPPRAPEKTLVIHRKRRSTAVGLAVLLVFAATGIISFVAPRHHRPPAMPAPVVAAAPVGAPPSAPVKGSAQPEPKSVRIQMASSPEGAEVLVEGERRGITPCAVYLPRSDTPVTLLLRKRGYRDDTLHITADHERSVSASLEALRPARASVRPSPPAQRNSAPARSKRGGPHELKDPFAD